MLKNNGLDKAWCWPCWSSPPGDNLRCHSVWGHRTGRAPRRSRASCDQGTTWRADTGSGNRSCLCCHPPQTLTSHPSCRSPPRAGGAKDTSSDASRGWLETSCISDRTHRERALEVWHTPETVVNMNSWVRLDQICLPEDRDWSTKCWCQTFQTGSFLESAHSLLLDWRPAHLPDLLNSSSMTFNKVLLLQTWGGAFFDRGVLVRALGVELWQLSSSIPYNINRISLVNTKAL